VTAAARRVLIVVAAGEVSRVEVCGLDPVQRALLAGAAAGAGERLLVAPAPEHPHWERRLAGHPKLGGGGGRLGSPAAAPAAAAELLAAGPADVLLAVADGIALPRLVAALGAAELPPGAAALAVTPDGSPEDAGGTGLCRVSGEALPQLLPPAVQGRAALGAALPELGDGLRLLPADGQFAPLGAPGAARAAERLLLRSLVKAADGVISRHINRKISLTISRQLARWPVRPNHVTAVVLLLGLASGPVAATGTWLGFALGGLLYYLAAILDGCDGELSRLKFLGTPLGTWLDTITDDLSALSFLVGLYVGLGRADPGWLVWGGVAVLGNVVTVLLRYRLLVRLRTGDHQQLAAREQVAAPASRLGRLLAWLKSTVIRTDFLPFAAFVTGACGCPWIFAAPYPLGALGAVIDSVLLTWRWRGRTR